MNESLFEMAARLSNVKLMPIAVRFEGDQPPRPVFSFFLFCFVLFPSAELLGIRIWEVQHPFAG